MVSSPPEDTAARTGHQLFALFSTKAVLTFRTWESNYGDPGRAMLPGLGIGEELQCCILGKSRGCPTPTASRRNIPIPAVSSPRATENNWRRSLGWAGKSFATGVAFPALGRSKGGSWMGRNQEAQAVTHLE